MYYCTEYGKVGNGATVATDATWKSFSIRNFKDRLESDWLHNKPAGRINTNANEK